MYTTVPLQKPNRLRPPHLDDAITFINGNALDSYEALDVTTGKGTLNSAIAALITTFKDGYPFASEEAFDTAADTLSTDIQALVTGEAHIPDSVTVDVGDRLEAIKTQLKATFATDGYDQEDPKCKGEGRHPIAIDPGEDPTNTGLRHCASCDGIGATATVNTSQTSWTETTEFAE